MNPPTWYSIDDLAAATGLTRRQLRRLLDTGRVHYVQWERGTKRLLNAATIRDLEGLGIPVATDLLTGQDGQDGQDSR